MLLLEVWTTILSTCFSIAQTFRTRIALQFSRRTGKRLVVPRRFLSREVCEWILLENRTHYLALKFAKVKTRRDRLRAHRGILNSFFNSTAFQTRSGTSLLHKYWPKFTLKEETTNRSLGLLPPALNATSRIARSKTRQGNLSSAQVTSFTENGKP